VLSFSQSLSETTGEIEAAMTTLLAAAAQHRGVKNFSDLSTAIGRAAAGFTIPL